MNDKAAHARAWLAKADSDLTAARRLLEHGGPYDAVCFHAQQAAEKALKALLAFSNALIPRTHNLEDLLQQCTAVISAADAEDLERYDLAELTPFAVESRYDIEFWPDEAEASAAVSVAAAVLVLASRVIVE
jgi:HEPN domain-containing protein